MLTFLNTVVSSENLSTLLVIFSLDFWRISANSRRWTPNFFLTVVSTCSTMRAQTAFGSFMSSSGKHDARILLIPSSANAILIFAA